MVRSSVPFYRGTVQKGPGQAAVLGLRVVVKVEGYIGLHPPGGKKYPCTPGIHMESPTAILLLLIYDHVQQHMFKEGEVHSNTHHESSHEEYKHFYS